MLRAECKGFTIHITCEMSSLTCTYVHCQRWGVDQENIKIHEGGSNVKENQIYCSSRQKNQEWDLAWQGDYWKTDFFNELKYQIITQAAHNGKSAVQQWISHHQGCLVSACHRYQKLTVFSRQLDQMTFWVPFTSNML